MAEIIRKYDVFGEYQKGPIIGSHKGEISLLSENRLIGLIKDIDFVSDEKYIIGAYFPKKNSLGIIKFSVMDREASPVYWFFESKIKKHELEGNYNGFYQFLPFSKEESLVNSCLNKNEIFEHFKKISSKEIYAFFIKSFNQTIKNQLKESNSSGYLEFKLR